MQLVNKQKDIGQNEEDTLHSDITPLFLSSGDELEKVFFTILPNASTIKSFGGALKAFFPLIFLFYLINPFSSDDFLRFNILKSWAPPSRLHYSTKFSK